MAVLNTTFHHLSIFMFNRTTRKSINWLLISLCFSACLATTLLSMSAKATPKADKETEKPSLQVKGELSISPLSDTLFVHESFMQTQQYGFVGSNGLVLIDDNKAYLIDTPWSEADTIKLVSWIENQGFTLAASVSTHSHEDRTAGVDYLNRIGVTTYASEHTNKLLKQAGKPTTTNSFKAGQFDFVESKAEVYFVGAGHTVDNLVVWFPQSKLLYGGCLVKSLGSKSLGYYGEADLDAWPFSIKQLQTQFTDTDRVLPGHGKMGDKQLLSHTISLLEQHAEQH
ncbi:subclass B1 metallo-beta-lactamase [Shewanella sp. 1_MG-2023]|uniref:subclass B1 metallo-beta-lactamase n=1 Tax=unclassified Shewanella TaxID=196818 RepID=UPI0026E26A26|nr:MULTISPECIES: subclass B1 metallo-beta-lactamase [unclassified Shewanella]MDO6610407.1 subclass B1 metallo-beta-lactamase [Shewanella sp. 7_MG-2023]MDO6770532.1 subclass B1 metallo-beta-lactamase [Shewanella sp. 2_MG-2023]MDO6794419.1 subclass B1 metallo-beta-lactamase [Shewanella sp. 1_MG-2023]